MLVLTIEKQMRTFTSPRFNQDCSLLLVFYRSLTKIGGSPPPGSVSVLFMYKYGFLWYIGILNSEAVRDQLVRKGLPVRCSVNLSMKPYSVRAPGLLDILA